jgi:formylglycine-generating enzyme
MKRAVSARALVVVATLAVAVGAIAALALPRPPISTPAVFLGSESSCSAYGGLPPEWGRDPHAGMVWLSGGQFTFGSDAGYLDERPVREATVAGFWIDRTEVTNAQFAAFVVATGYVTDAERRGAGVIFRSPEVNGSGEVAYGSWWHEVAGANWRHPAGPASDLQGLMHHPVVQVTRADAQAYARWLGRRLPTEAEWEFAAKAGGAPERIERGPRGPDGRPSANFWQGQFPYLDLGEDGHKGLAPVGCFTANGYGLHDMIGNVWEWTADPWQGTAQAHGTDLAYDHTRRRVDAAPRGLIKGGSFLCSTDYCVRYRASARHPQDLDVPAAHVGFRTVAG